MILRYVLLIVGVLIILGIALDGWRRKRRRLQKNARQSIEPTIHSNNSWGDNMETSTPSATTSPEIPTVAQTPTEREESPSIAVKAETNVTSLAEKTGTSEAHNVEIETITAHDSANQAVARAVSIRAEPILSANEVIPKPILTEKVALQPTKPAADNTEVITLTVMSINSRPFAGYDLIKALEENHLHYGEFNVYHRHKYKNGKGPLYFSIASVVKPGTLDPKSIGTLSTPGLALFMQLNNRKHDRIVFKQVLATAHQLAKSLGGVVCDAKRVPLREATLQSYTEKLDL